MKPDSHRPFQFRYSRSLERSLVDVRNGESIPPESTTRHSSQHPTAFSLLLASLPVESTIPVIREANSNPGSTNLQIAAVAEDSILLQAVIELGDRHSQYLGFFPAEAFRKSAAKGYIIAASTPDGALLGYALFYLARSRVVLQQLCVSSDTNRKGIGRQLLEYLKSITKRCHGIAVHCKRAFPAHSFWPKVGFHAVSEKPGRGKKAETLTFFWLDYGHPDLLSSLAQSRLESKLVAVLDANVVYDLHNPKGARAVQSLALLADWLQEEIVLSLTDEIFNEMDRNEDAAERQKAKDFARGFPKITASPEQRKQALNDLEHILPRPVSVQDDSDRRQLASAIAGGARFFVTRDRELVKYADEVWSRFGIRVLFPADLIVHLDEYRRQADYEPARLAGTKIIVRRVASADVPRLADAFLTPNDGETKSHFNDRLRQAVSSPDRTDALLVEALDHTPLALAITVSDPHAMTLTFARVAPNALAGTLARNLVLRAITASVTKKCSIIMVADPHPSAPVIDALKELGFARPDGKTWLKVNLTGVQSPASAAREVSGFAAQLNCHSATLRALSVPLAALDSLTSSAEEFAEAEQLIWPGKLTSERLRTFIVPIKPQWALHLFDPGLANQTLHGALPQLALSCEHVYYRGSKPRVLVAPSRVLWYVSHEQTYQGTKEIRACSSLDEVIVGRAKDLYKRFQRLGVYEWNHIKRLAKGNAEKEIMAFRFGVTEVFANPISREKIADILRDLGKSDPPLSTPYEISAECFRQIYSDGISATDKQ